MDRLPPRERLAALTLALVASGWLASCAQPTVAPKPQAAPAPVPAVAPAPQPAPPPPPAAPAVPEGPTPGSPAAVQLAQRATTAAIELLELGNEDQAAAELQRAVHADPSNKLAHNLLKQVQTDPLELLGRESFSYRVQPGESLSRIAQRFLGDVHLFYALARYNDIRVPRQLQGGQTIKVPGKAPPPAAPVAATPVVAPKPAPAPEPAPVPVDERTAARERQAKISAATRAARSAFARQDLNGAIRHWDTVLDLDPDNSTAQLERKKAIELRDKLRRVK